MGFLEKRRSRAALPTFLIGCLTLLTFYHWSAVWAIRLATRFATASLVPTTPRTVGCGVALPFSRFRWPRHGPGQKESGYGLSCLSRLWLCVRPGFSVDCGLARCSKILFSDPSQRIGLQRITKPRVRGFSTTNTRSMVATTLDPLMLEH
jgi:hypothetical protein